MSWPPGSAATFTPAKPLSTSLTGRILRLRVPVSGSRLVGETAGGVHYAGATGPGVRFGAVSWTEASGKRTELRARAVAGSVEVQVPSSLLASSSFPATLATVISPEFGLDTPVTDPGAGAQTTPAIASNGKDYFVVWSDERVNSAPDLYGARVSGEGVVLEPLGILISAAPNGQKDPAVAFDGTNYFVVWHDSRQGNGIYGARVSQAGVVLDANGVKISPTLTTPYVMSHPAIAFDGTNFLVVWEFQDGYFAPPDLMGVLVSQAGARVGGSITVSNAANLQTSVSLAFDGTNYLAVWQDTRSARYDTYAARISTAGTVLDPTGIRVGSGTHGQFAPRVAFQGTHSFVVWEDDRNASTTGSDVYGARISPDGSVLDPSGIPLIQAVGAQTRPVLVRAGTGFLMAWQDARRESTPDVYAARLSEAGTVLDTSGFPVLEAPLAQSSVAVAGNGTDFFLAWSDARMRDIVGARLSANATVLDPGGFTLSFAPNSQTQPAAAFDGTNFLVVWQDNRGEGQDIYGVRVSTSGAVLDPAAIPIAVAPNQQLTPAVAFDGTNYLVIWEDRRNGPSDLYGARVSQAGEVLDPSGLVLAVPGVQDRPALAFDGTNYLAVWSGWEGTSSRDILGVRVSPSGTVLDGTFIPICTNTRYQWMPAVAFNGENYLVVWSDTPNDGTFDLYGARVSTGGVVLDTEGVLISGGPYSPYEAAMASDGTDILIAWYESSPSTGIDIRAQRVSRTGSVLHAAPIAVAMLAGTQALPSVMYDGTDYLVAWQDSRNNAISQGDIYAGRVSRAGEVLDGNGFILSANPGSELSIALAGGPEGVLAVYEVPEPTLGAGVQRMRARVLTAQSNTPPTADAQRLTPREDEAAVVTLSGSDPDGDPLTYTVATKPTHGTLTGTAPDLTYTPAPDYHGEDRFTFTVSDGKTTSEPATVSLSVTPVNDAPVASAQSRTTAEDMAASLLLSGSDVDGDTLTFSIATSPAHGTLTGTAPSLTYTPAPGYHGPDSFTFTVSDGRASSAPATVSLSVTPVNDAPVAEALSLTVPAGSPTPIYLSGNDADDDTLTYAIVTPPGTGKLTGTPPEVVYTPPPGFRGTTRFSFSVSDGTDSSSADVQLTVVKRSLTVSAAADSLRPSDSQPVRFYANAVDEAGAPISLQWDFGDGHVSEEQLPVHAFSAPGLYVVRLTASTATEEASTSLRLRVRTSSPFVLSPEDSPARAVGEEGSALSFRVEEPLPDLIYSWDFGDGSSSTGPSVSHAWGDDGLYTLTLTASGAGGPLWTASRSVVVHNAPPVPLPQDPLAAHHGLPLSVRLAASDAAADGDPLLWELVSGDGSLSPDGTFQWKPDREGLATVITKVLDDDGGEARLAFQIRSGEGIQVAPPSGCGCGSASGGAPGALGLLLVVLTARARRARR